MIKYLVLYPLSYEILMLLKLFGWQQRHFGDVLLSFELFYNFFTRKISKISQNMLWWSDFSKFKVVNIVLNKNVAKNFPQQSSLVVREKRKGSVRCPLMVTSFLFPAVQAQDDAVI